MNKYKNIDYQIERCDRYNLPSYINKWLQEGWDIIYVIPGVQINQSSTYSYSSSSCSTGTYTIDTSTGQQTYHMPIQQYNPPEPLFEVYMIKYEVEQESCPKCSHLNPDRLDREA